MMTKFKDTGGSAFPWESVGPQGEVTGSAGATVRDWFAYGVAPTLVAICAGDPRNPDETVAQYVARRAYEVADAMIAERAKP